VSNLVVLIYPDVYGVYGMLYFLSFSFFFCLLDAPLSHNVDTTQLWCGGGEAMLSIFENKARNFFLKKYFLFLRDFGELHYLA